MGQERLEEADPEIGDESNADRPRDLRPEDPADRMRERQRDEVYDEGGKAGDNRHAFAALEGSPYEGAHDDDFQSSAQAHRDSDVTFRATERCRQHDRKRDRTEEHSGVKQGEGRESQYDR